MFVCSISFERVLKKGEILWSSKRAFYRKSAHKATTSSEGK